MNINAVSYRQIDNIYKVNNAEKKQNVEKSKKTDTVEISDLGKYLNKVSSEKDMDIDRVNDIKTRIENGTYKIDSKDLAKKIIQHMKGEI